MQLWRDALLRGVAIGAGEARRDDQVGGGVVGGGEVPAKRRRVHECGAQSDDHQAAASTLSAAGTACAGGPAVVVSADRWEPGGVVTVTVSCTVERGDLGAIDAPARTLRGSSRAVLDEYRGFGP